MTRVALACRFLLDLVLPRACAGCGRAGAGAALCAGCLPAGAPVAAAGGALAAGRYEGALRSALLRYKERGRRDLAADLAGLLARAVAGVLARDPPVVGLAPVPGPPGPPGPAGPGRGPAPVPLPMLPVLVPVPSSRDAAAARGGDHLVRLARRAGRELGVPVATPLRLVRAGRDSAGLTAAQRATERHRSMRARPAPPAVAGRAVVIVDDVVTTGATLREARRALLAEGWTVLGAAAVAATPRI